MTTYNTELTTLNKGKDTFDTALSQYKDAYEKKITPLKSRLPRIIEKYEKLKLNKEDSKKIIILKNYYKQVNDMERKTKKIIEIFEND